MTFSDQPISLSLLEPHELEETIELLVERLQTADETFAHGRDSGRAGILIALIAIHSFLETVILERPKLATGALIQSLGALNLGVTAPFLQPRETDRGAPPDPMEGRLIVAVMSAVVSFLVSKSGIGRAQTLESACRFVATHANRIGFRYKKDAQFDWQLLRRLRAGLGRRKASVDEGNRRELYADLVKAEEQKRHDITLILLEELHRERADWSRAQVATHALKVFRQYFPTAVW